MPNIAIIDNDPELAKVCELAFASRGHTLAFLANNCSEAFEKLKTMDKTPDMLIVCVDHESDVLNRIKSEFPAIIIKEVRGKKSY